MHTAYEEILDFITSSPTLRQIIAFTHSAATLERVAYLTTEEENGFLTQSEREELREFQKAVDFIEQLKIRARRRLEEKQAAQNPDVRF